MAPDTSQWEIVGCGYGSLHKSMGDGWLRLWIATQVNGRWLVAAMDRNTSQWEMVSYGYGSLHKSMGDSLLWLWITTQVNGDGLPNGLL